MINRLDTYSIFLPYVGWWPRVTEMHYTPSPAERGRAPILGVRRDQFWRYLEPLKLDPSAPRVQRVTTDPLDQDEAEQIEQRIPLKAILELEAAAWSAHSGETEYLKRQTASLNVLHLVLEDGGEVLAEYLWMGGPNVVLLHEHLYFQGVEEPPREARSLIAIDPSAILACLPEGASAKTIHNQRMKVMTEQRFKNVDTNDLVAELDRRRALTKPT